MQLRMQVRYVRLDFMQLQMQLRYACLDHMQLQMQLRYACLDHMLHSQCCTWLHIRLSEHDVALRIEHLHHAFCSSFQPLLAMLKVMLVSQAMILAGNVVWQLQDDSSCLKPIWMQPNSRQQTMAALSTRPSGTPLTMAASTL